MDRPTLIALLQDNHTRFEQALAKVNSIYLTEPFPGDPRSIKDILIHLTTWEQRLVRWLRETARGETPAIPEPGLTWADMDRLNEETLRQNSGRSLEDILVAWHSSFQELLAQIEVFSDSELFETGHFAWLTDEDGSEPLWESIVAGPGCCHYHDHFYDLLARTEPANRFVPDPTRLQAFAGIYVDDRALVFYVADNNLIMKGLLHGNNPQPDLEIPGLAVDNTHFAFKDFGLVTFQQALDGTVPALEWWNQAFRRTEG